MPTTGPRRPDVPELPRPHLAPGPHRQFNDALHDLHHEAGWPSLRSLASAAACSHTTVSHAFSADRLPAWGLVELLVEAMGGDPARFQDLWIASSTPHDGTAPVEVPAIAGRRSELAAVRRHLEDGAGLLVVAGEPGMGKTRLMATAAALAGERVFLVRGSCLPLSTQVPLLPVIDALRMVLERDGGDWLVEALASCPAYVPASLSRLLPEVADLATVEDPDDDWSRNRLFSAVGAALDALAALKPVGIIIEDLHWADGATLDLLEHLVVHGHRVPVVGTRRINDPDLAPTASSWWERIRRLPVPIVELAPLSRAETRDQLAMLLGGGVDDDTVDRIQLRSLGNPLFTEQVARGGLDSFPRLLADILDHRLEGLSPSAWLLCRTLGTADRSLPRAVVEHASALPPDDLVAALRELQERYLLAETGAGEIGLSHPLLAQAVRRQLVPGEAPDAHGRLAAALSTLPRPAAAEVAAHWQGAGDEAAELAWRVAAARQAEQRFAPVQAATHWLRCLDLWPADHSPAGDPPLSHLQAYQAAMDALEASAQNERASVVAARALELTPGLSDRDLAGLYRRAADFMADIDEEAALTLVDRSIDLHRKGQPTVGLLRALRLRAAILGDLGRVDEALAAAGRAVAISERLDDPLLLRGSLMSLAWHEAVSGRTQDALRHAGGAARIATAGTDPMHEVGLAMRHTDLLLICGADVDELERAAGPALAAVREWRIDNVESATLLSNVSEGRRRAGRVAQAAELVDPWTDGPLQQHRWALHIERAKLDMLRGRSDEAIARFDELARLEMPSLWGRAEIARCVARNQIWLRQPQAALDCLLSVIDEAVDTDALASMGPLLVLAASAAGDLVEQLPARLADTRRRELVDRLTAARARVSSDPMAAWRGGALATSWAAELARVEGTATVELWLEAAAGWDDLGRPHRAAYCRWRAAQVARATGQAGLAAKLLRRAARDAREHLPLMTWIRATAVG
jgi:tetratricopeptide (TPR) repeat protein/type II secretory pathway predicted ATPase ExeA